MKISGISFRFPSFLGRKILYSDFDGTYFPFVRSDITPTNYDTFRNMYLPFINYKKSQGDDFELNITTGRSKNDYLHTQEKIQSANLPFCYPDGLISSNGANVFKFEGGIPISIFPENDSKAQGAADEIVKLILGSDEDIALVECKINGDEETYQEYSSEYELDKLRPEKYISVARDGKYNAEIVVSKDIDFNKVCSLVKDYVDKNALPFTVEHYENALYTKGFEYSDNTKKEVNANVIFLKYSQNNMQADKFDIVKKEVQKIQQDNSDDFIIVAGDGFNDEKMLNPLNYIDGDKDIDNPETILKLINLPLRVIICGDDPKLNDLRELAKKLKEKGVEVIKLAPDSKTDFIKAIKEFDSENENKAEFYLDILTSSLSSDNIDSQKISAIEKHISELSSKDKEKFIELYCKHTGFPDMKKTSKLIVDNVTKALLDAADKTNVEILLAGYNPTCSVANGHALPGSDFDTFFVCLKNWDNFNNFNKQFKNNIDPLLCSVTWPRTNDVPDFVTVDDIIKSIKQGQNVFESQNFDRNSAEYEETLNRQVVDWTEAGKYNLDINEFIADDDKTRLLRAGLLMEILRDGKVIVDNLDESVKNFFKESCVYKYSNMQQMRSYKNAPLKNKHRNREQILTGFDELDTNEKLDLIFSIVKLSVKDLKSKVDERYKPMFQDAGCGNMEDLIQPLLTNKHRLEKYKNK